MSSSEIRNIPDIASMERYIQNHNYVLNGFEDRILQFLFRYYRENQLFFILKNGFPYPDCYKALLEKYDSVIQKRYSSHQTVQVGVRANLYLLRGFTQFDFGCGSFVFKEVRKTYEEASEDLEHQVLYEDDDILIFTISLRVTRVDGIDERHFYEDGYWINLSEPNIIRPFSSPYLYHYSIIGQKELLKEHGREWLKRQHDETNEIIHDYSLRLGLTKKID